VETLAPFTLGQVRHFVPAWYAELAEKTTLTSENAQRYSERLVERIVPNRQLAEMAETPLLLTMMALVLYNKGDLPRDRPQLYEDILDLLLGRWDTVQEKGGHTLAEYIGLPEWDSERLLPLLDRLSYDAHRTAASEDGRGRLAKHTVHETLISFFEQSGLSRAAAFEKAGRCLEYIQLRSGLLMPDGDASYVFAHLTLQEHCAGRYMLLTRRAVKFVLEHRADDRWRVPIFLGLGVVQKKNPFLVESVLRALVERDEEISRKPIDRWYRDLILAAEIGEDRDWGYLQQQDVDVTAIQRDVRQGLAELLNDMQPPLPFKDRVHAGFLLGDLGHDSRLLDPATGTRPDGRYTKSG
jgi:predicted NACHT family NTPase